MKEQSNKLWFKRRRYGWGWTPVTWQGWLSVVICLMLVLATPFLLFPVKPEQPTTAQIILFLMIAAGAILMLVGISIIKGPSPRFRWGKKPTDNPDEDL